MKKMNLHGIHGIRNTAAAALIGLAPLLSTGACSPAQNDEFACGADSTLVHSGARRVLDVDLDATPGPILVTVSSATAIAAGDIGPRADSIRGEAGLDETGAEIEPARRQSRPHRIWVQPDGRRLLALHRDQVTRIDIATFALLESRKVARETGSLVATPSARALLLTDRIAGTMLRIPAEAAEDLVRIPVGAGPNAIALGPAGRLAYVANEISQSITLVDTGLGTPVQDDCRVFVSTLGAGVLFALDRDGWIRERYEGLPTRPRDLVLLPDGFRLLGSYTDLVVTGESGTVGDGELALDEGVFVLDLRTGQVSRWSLADRAPRPGSLGRPSGLALLSGGRQVAVAVPGWHRVFVLATGMAPAAGTAGRGSAGSSGQPSSDGAEAPAGTVLQEVAVAGEPTWLAPGARPGDWLYVLDDRAGTLQALDATGAVVAQVRMP